MRGTGEFRSPAGKARYTEAYEAAMREGPVPDKELDVETTYGTTRVYRYGDAGTRPIVLLPGLSGTAAAWAPIVGELGERHPVYTVDTIGEPGMSVQTAPLRDHTDRATWLDEVMARLDLTDVHLVGASSGGFYAVWQAIHAPDRLASVTLIDPTTVTAGFSAKVLWLGLSAMIINRDKMWRRFMRGTTGADVVDRPDTQVVLAGIKHFRVRLPPQVRPPASAIATIDLPVLALFAERSKALNAPLAARRLRELLPHAEVELWPDLGHFLWEERHRKRIVERILART